MIINSNLGPLIISLLSLTISVLGFYWSHIRIKARLKLYRLPDRSGLGPQFILYNYGNKDVVISRADIYFDLGKRNQWCAQKLEFESGRIIKPYSSGIFNIEFKYGYPPKEQLKPIGKDNKITTDVTLLIEWIDMESKKSSAIKLYDLIIEENGSETYRTDLKPSIELKNQNNHKITAWQNRII